jgi:hypothetical protein
MSDQSSYGLSTIDVTMMMPRILEDLADGMLSDQEAGAVANWVLATADEDAPVWLVNRAVRIARQSVVAEAPRPAAWRRLVAVLVSDTRLQPRPMGARSAIVEQRRLLYRVDDREIDLEIGPSQITGRVRLLGQVAASATELAEAWVVAKGPAGRLESDVDAEGQFALDGLAHGVHHLEIGLDHEVIEIPSVPL